MNLWPVYDYLVNRVHPYMVRTGDCLYNALVLTLSESPRAGSRLTRDELLTIRDSALELARFIEDELLDRDAEDSDSAYSLPDSLEA